MAILYTVLCTRTSDGIDRMSSLTNTLASLHHIMEEVGGEQRGDNSFTDW